MESKRIWLADAAIGGVYCVLAAISILATRFDGGLAYLWIANAFLVTVLLRRPRSSWTGPVVWGAIGSGLATSVVGVGWVLAPALAVANVAEALVAAYILRRTHSALLPLGSLKWNTTLICAAGVAGPLAMGLIAMLPLWLNSGQPPMETLFRAIAGHGLSNLTFIPILKLFATAKSGPWKSTAERRPDFMLHMLCGLFVVATIAVFSQDSLPLLFLPILPLVGIVFRGGSRCIASALLMLVVIGSTATLLGFGPAHLPTIGLGQQMQFAQLYFVATVLTIVPIAAQLRREDWLSRRVRDSEARYRMFADHSGDVIMHTDALGAVRFVSPSIERVGGFAAGDLIGRNCLHMIHPDFHERVIEHHTFVQSAHHNETRFEYRARRKDGRWGWFESDCRGLVEPNGERGVISMIRDISERKEREEQLARAAMTNSLTGLPNRRAFREAVAQITANGVNAASIALLDIDHFKSVNDRFGHDAGDEVLQAFAITAQHLLREGDMIARLGGEEFGLLLPDTNETGAIKLCERLRAAVADSVCVTAAGPVRITISGGVAAIGKRGIDAALKRADTALYQAKNQGRDRLMRAA